MTNSFWREVLDHIPGLVLLFRIDESEEAHLMFVNSEVQPVLGYTPEDFVLASETEGTTVQKEIARLIEHIASMSHDGEDDDEPTCRFYSKRAVAYLFSFEFRIFGVNTNPLPYIAVLLEPKKEQNSGKQIPATQKKQEGASGSDVGMPYVAESPLMKALMQKIDAVADKQVHLLLRGDKGTGKRTIARQILKAEAHSGALCAEWDMMALNPLKQEETISQWKHELSNTPGSKRVVLVSEIGKMSLSSQKRFQDIIRNRMNEGGQTRILATSSFVLEELVKKEKFSMELYYFLSFENLLIPPLSQRKEDIRLLVKRWVPRASAALGIPEPAMSTHVLERIMENDWQGNFPELFQVLRSSLLRSTDGEFRLSYESAPAKIKDIESRSVGEKDLVEILPFDEMTRRYLEDVLKATKGKIYGRDGAARALGMKPTTLQSKLKKLGVR